MIYFSKGLWPFLDRSGDLGGSAAGISHSGVVAVGGDLWEYNPQSRSVNLFTIPVCMQHGEHQLNRAI